MVAHSSSDAERLLHEPVPAQHLAGTTVHYVTHKVSYLIDPAAYERAMFAWLFAPQDVLATLRRIAHA